MQEPHDVSEEQKKEKPTVVTKVPLATSRFGKFRERFISPLSKQRQLQIGLFLFLILSIPLTVVLSQRQQDVRQHASEKRFSDPKYIGSLPPFNDLVDLENQLVASHANSQFKIQQSDYAKCPDAVPNQPGWWDPASKKNSNAAGASDPDWYFGIVKDGTDPVNDPFYTTGKANVEARWAGDSRYPVASPHDRGIGYSYGEYIPGIQRIGGWSYDWNKDHACWSIGTYNCSLDGNGMPKGGGRNGYARAMGWASVRTNNLAKGTTLKNRECVLALAVMETRQEWLKALVESDSPVRNAAQSVRNPEATGFYLASNPTTGSNDTSSNGTGQNDVINTAATDQNSCTDHTFSDVSPDTDKTLAAAASCLGLKQYCTVRGFGDGTLKPNDPATRAYVVAFLTRYHVYVLKDWQFVDLLSIPDSSLYTDVPKDYGLALEIYTAREKGLLSKSITAFKPDDPWFFGFKGVNPTDYDFSKTESSMTRGEFIKAVYTYGTTGKGKGQLNACSGTSSTGALKDPPTFTESENDKDTRIKVCGDKASLLNGHITSQPSVASFKDGLYVFAKGREDKLYVRKLTPTVNADGTLANLSNSPWTELGKQIAGDILTEVQNEEGIQSLSVIVRDKLDTKSYIKSNTGTSWGSWIENKGSLTNQMKNDQVVSVDNMTYSFNKGNESSENNLCMTVSALPFTGGIKTNPAGSAPNPQTSPAASNNTPASSDDNNTLTGEYDTIQACKDANPGATTAECCSKSLKWRDGCPTTASNDVTSTAGTQKPNLMQQFWSWLTNLF